MLSDFTLSDAYTSGIRQGHSVALRAVEAAVRADEREKVIEQLRWLGNARAEYDHMPEGGYHSATESDRLIYHEHRAAAGLADILEGTNDGMGWLPSWKWDEWAAIRAVSLVQGNLEPGERQCSECSSSLARCENAKSDGYIKCCPDCRHPEPTEGGKS